MGSIIPLKTNFIMMKNKWLSAIIALFLVALVVMVSCKKDEDDKDTATTPTLFDPLHVYSTYMYVSWSSEPGISGYKLDVATDQGFTSKVPGYDNKDVGVKSVAEISGLNPVTDYYLRVKSYNSNGESGYSSSKIVRTAGMDTIRNMDFERWIQYVNFQEPSPHRIWATANKTKDLNPGLYPATTEKTTDAVSGQYAAKMFTAQATGLPLLTGTVSTGVFNVNLNDPLKSMVTGVPYRTKPVRFKGYFKYLPGVDNAHPNRQDSCEIRATLFRWDKIAGQRDTIGEAIHRTADSVKVYEQFDVPFVYYNGNQPDSMELIFASSSKGSYFIGNVGSTLFVDGVELEFAK